MDANGKRLQFLLSFMESNGIGKNDLARTMGVSAQNIFTYFKRDSMKLSYAQEIFSRYGYTLSFALEKEQQSTDAVIIDIQPLVSPGGLKRLAFLRVAFALYGINRKTLAEALDLNLAGVNRWFHVDDIAIAYIFKIAELYGLKVRITATPKNKATQLA